MSHQLEIVVSSGVAGVNEDTTRLHGNPLLVNWRYLKEITSLSSFATYYSMSRVHFFLKIRDIVPVLVSRIVNVASPLYIMTKFKTRIVFGVTASETGDRAIFVMRDHCAVGIVLCITVL